ncbi:Myosin heavy chain [Mycetohabitans rhizoxinica HKI 454]|uniref:Myosin heavy chain n=1 Tax=Mycetohabitans rhizoxinica (strain DSM 19002 / CIP 109453 / HKI 454) TaxID=882378 RepID=E5AQK4_MYCRK|nr:MULTISPECIES: myosin heavy subunit [Mycetohabitans]MCG1046951.1 colicin transporter [Mycetohabitans sp. B6]CBW74886.1 Myosin heavy chain [Mycetohabitans rhizoxinica HKI 454]
MHDRLPMSSPAPYQRVRESMPPSGSLSSRAHRRTVAITHTARRKRAWPLVGWLLACVASVVPAAPLYAQAADWDGADGRARDASSFGARQAQLDRRSELNRYEYGVAKHNCYSAILVNHCLEKARNRMIANKMRIRDEQNALDNERRAVHARQRDEQAALKREAYAREAPQRAARERENEQSYDEKQRQHAINEARRTAQAPQREASQRAYDQKQADYQRKLEQARRQAAQDAQQRADNVRKFEQKQQRAVQHARDVRERQARKQGASTPGAASAASGMGGQ